VVAPGLLGKVLAVGRKRAVIVETEAYVGAHDLAAHSRSGVTDRNRVMWGPGGRAYVYLIYGMHEMFNVVTGPADSGEAVLVRAAEWLGPGPVDSRELAGPGKLTRKLGISRRHSGLDLTAGKRISIWPGKRFDPSAIAMGPRIGVDYAGEWASAPLRFCIAGHPALSRPV